MRIEIQWNSLFPLSMPYVTTLQYREIFWQNGSLLYGSDTAKQEFFMRLQLRLQSLHKHDFISNQLLFYCWLTQQHFNFSVSFSFKQEALLYRFMYFPLNSRAILIDTIFIFISLSCRNKLFNNNNNKNRSITKSSGVVRKHVNVPFIMKIYVRLHVNFLINSLLLRISLTAGTHFDAITCRISLQIDGGSAQACGHDKFPFMKASNRHMAKFI